MIIYFTLCIISMGCAIYVIYVILEKDVRISDDIVGDGTAARSRFHCMTMCASRALCETYSYVNNKCTLSSKQIDVNNKCTLSSKQIDVNNKCTLSSKQIDVNNKCTLSSKQIDVNNKCTLSSKQIDGHLAFTKYSSLGEGLYSG